MSKRIIGIDLGTCTSEVAVMDNGQATVIQNSEGGRTTPSVVGFTAKGERIVGLPAKNQMVTNPTNTVYSIKRLIGKKYSEVSKEDISRLPYKIVNHNDDVRVEITENGAKKELSPQEISAIILQKMKKTAEDYIGETITDAVITVPAYFNDAQRQATKDAGKIAGLDVKRIINEPTAAALAFGFKESDKSKEQTLVVADIGGGTTDITILQIADGVFEVVSTNGDTHLGGDDWDNAISDWLIDEFKKENNIDLSKDPMAKQRIKEAAENAKIALSNQTSTEINLPFITADANGPKHLNRTLTRAQFEQMTSNLVDRILVPCKNALADAKLSLDQIGDVLLVGGSSRIPAIQEAIKKFFNKEPLKGINPDEAVSMGAAIQGGVLVGDVKDVLLLDVTPLSLGIETSGGIFTKLIPRNTTIPTKKSQIFSTAADGQTAVTVHVLQGEREIASENRTIGNFNLEGIPTAPRGVPQIEVSFDVDSNSILHVSAKDLGTGKEQTITISNNSNLSDADIERMCKDAEAHADEDKKKKDDVDTRNNADSLIYSTEKTLKDLGDKVNTDDRTKIESAVSELKESIKGTDIEDIKKKSENLKNASYSLAEQLYKNQGADKTAQNFTENANKNAKGTTSDNVDYEVKDA